MLHQFTEKIKTLVNTYFWGLAAFLIIVVVAGLWRIFVVKQVKIEPRIERGAFQIDLDREGVGSFVASKNGAVYYPKTCKSASRIKSENRLFFASALEAEGAGFRRSAQCGN
ncbi:MAG: hypothetical protein AAB367_03905 [Patescibacteria group bacterium]